MDCITRNKAEGNTKLEGPGIHLVAYYCSQEHLLLKTAIFVKQGLDVGEKVCYYLYPEHDQLFLGMLRRLGVNLDEVKKRGQLQAIQFEEIYDVFQTSGYNGVRATIQGMLVTSLNDGFSGVRCVGDSRYGIMKYDAERFFEWEKEFDRLLMGIPIISLCLYDIQDLLVKDSLTCSMLINQTMECHKYFFNENKIFSSDRFCRKGA